MAQVNQHTFSTAARSGNFVSEDMFGTNMLHSVNVDETGNVLEESAQALQELGITRLRYPGGMQEALGDILEGTTETELSPRLENFLNWVAEQNANGSEFTVTLGLPTKRFLDAEQISNFARIIGERYSEFVVAIEVGNEYSIGADTINEQTYGARANLAINALNDGFRDAGLMGDQQPDILMQMAEIFGRGSTYNGTGEHALANMAILDRLNASALREVDGVINHYYYIRDHNGDDSFDAARHIENQQTRFLSQKLDAWNLAWNEVTDLPELDLHVSEWNVQRLNYDQLGLKAAGAVLYQFATMIELGTVAAEFWPLLHRSNNSITNQQDGLSLTPSAMLIASMIDELGTDDAAMELLHIETGTFRQNYETVGFRSSEKTVLYIASRQAETTVLQLDLSAFGDFTNMSATVIGYDRASSDGLSEHGNEDGTGRVARRVIDQEELDKLSTLAFFDETDHRHVWADDTLDAGTYLTYLPQFDDIIPLVDAPQTVQDYYFPTEIDVSGTLEELTQSEIGSFQNARIQLDGFEVVEIVLENQSMDADVYCTLSALHTADLSYVSLNSLNNFELPDLQISSETANLTISGSTGADTLSTGHGDDLASGLDGDDFIYGHTGDDTLNGNTGQDTLMGGPGDDVIYGHQSHDILIGCDGNDTLDGGFGQDTFVFRHMDAPQHDVVRDFDVDEDVLLFQDLGRTQQLGRATPITVEESADGIDILYGSDRITFNGLDLDDFAQMDIVFT